MQCDQDQCIISQIQISIFINSTQTIFAYSVMSYRTTVVARQQTSVLLHSFISLRINQKPENMYKKQAHVQSTQCAKQRVVQLRRNWIVVEVGVLSEFVHKQGNLKNVPFFCQDRSWLNSSLNEQMYMYYHPTWEKAFATFRSRISFKTLSTTPKTTDRTFLLPE